MTLCVYLGTGSNVFVHEHVLHEKGCNNSYQILSPSLQSSPANECLGMDYLLQAAERGMKLAMLEVAKAFDSGIGLGKAPEGDPSFPAKQRYDCM